MIKGWTSSVNEDTAATMAGFCHSNESSFESKHYPLGGSVGKEELHSVGNIGCKEIRFLWYFHLATNSATRWEWRSNSGSAIIAQTMLIPFKKKLKGPEWGWKSKILRFAHSQFKVS